MTRLVKKLMGVWVGLGICMAAPDMAAAANLTPFPKAKATAAIRGKILFEGVPPKRKRIRIQGDEYCEMAHEGEKVYREDVLVHPGGLVENVFVHVCHGADQWKFDVPSDPVVLNQRGCRYTPHVVGIMAGQNLEIRNEDDTTHNVRFVAKSNRVFNLTQKKGQTETKVLRRKEIMARLKCDIHSWMGAYIGIVYHPFYQVTGSDGAFELGKLPPGKYVVQAWHEKFGALVQDVEIKDGEVKEVHFTFHEQTSDQFQCR